MAVAAVSAIAAARAAERDAAPTRPPNIVYILADELGYYELSGMGNPNLRTPNIDRLAAEGVRFTQMMAGSSVCAPTRCCLLTGKHSGHTSVRANDGGTPQRAGEVTFASILKPLGYATGGFGKWGNGGRGSTGVPEQHGFDVFLGYYDQVHAHSYYTPYLVRNSEEVPLPGNRGVSDGTNYTQYVIHAAALQFIRESKDRPFLAYLPYTPPHGIFDIPDTDPAWALFKDQPWPEPARRYAAMVGMLDRQVGEVLALLKELGLDERTVVFFSGDNGGADYFASKDQPRGVHGANKDPKTGVEFRGHKGNLYEGGLRVPFIARWPGRIAPGRVSDHLGYFPDVMPTIAELTGAKAPDDLDGVSILPELIGEKAAGRAQARHKYLYWEIAGQTAVREGTWKAVQPGPKAAWELYDLAADVSESKDLAAEKPDILTRLKAYAAEAHQPAQPGTYSRTDLHQRDRAAKFGDHPPAVKPPPRKRQPGPSSR
jgi:arylsulfatase A-like enzyme